MINWPSYPMLYEINTWVWLSDLSLRIGQPINLVNVPQDELERIADLGFDGIWLMGVWQRSPAARQVARTYTDWQNGYLEALSGCTYTDIIGSPYAILEYRVDPRLGGDQGLASLRERLAELDLRLMLDFVPNHWAIDHAWLKTHPERFIQGDPIKLDQDPDNYFSYVSEAHQIIFAHGRDPNFPGWPDTVQLDYRSADTRRAMINELLSIASRCDGVRCDMAMLLVSEIFRGTWGGQFDPATAEFWPAAISELKAKFPGFLTMAEVYWDLEWLLQQQGFDYTYDKRLYDRLLSHDAVAVNQHLHADIDFQRHLVHFIENHDESRSAEAFGEARSKVVATLSFTLPGLRLLHEGQLEGRQVKLPVQLGRRQFEEPLQEIIKFYRRLLTCLRHPIFQDGSWKLLTPQSYNTVDTSYRNIIAHQWIFGQEIRVIIANLSKTRTKFILPFRGMELADQNWLFRDQLNDYEYPYSGDKMKNPGLSFELPGYGYHLFEVLSAI